MMIKEIAGCIFYFVVNLVMKNEMLYNIINRARWLINAMVIKR